MRNLYLTICLLFALSNLSAQDCVVNLPENAVWIGQTKHPVGEEYGKNESVAIIKTGENEFSISDLSGGTFQLFETNSDIPASFVIECDNSIRQATIETDFGPFTINGGFWDPSSQKLEIYWSNPFNKLTDRVSIITLKN